MMIDIETVHASRVETGFKPVSTAAARLKKGVLEIIILNVLRKKDRYGYDIIKEISKNSDGFFELKEGTLYPLLYRLNTKGLIDHYWGTESNEAARRKYYHLTEKGAQQLEVKIEKWHQLIQTVNQLINDKNGEESS